MHLPFTDRPRTPEVVIHAPMEKKGLASSIQTKPPNSAAPQQQQQQKPPSFQPPAQPTTRNPAQPLPAPAPAPPPPNASRAPPSGPALPSQNNVMQPRSSTMNPPRMMNQAGANSAMGGAATSPSITNCDISNTTDNTAMFQMPNHHQQPPMSRQPPQQPTVQPRGRSREHVAQPPMFQVTSTTSKGQANSQASRPRGRLGNFLQPWLYICFNDNRWYHRIFFLPLFKGFLDLPFLLLFCYSTTANLPNYLRLSI